MNSKKRLTSLFVCICMLVTLFSGITTVQAAKNNVVIDFEQAELKTATNGYGFNDSTYSQGDGWTVKMRKSHPGHSAEIVDGTYGKTSKVLKVKTTATTAGANFDPTNQVTVVPDNSNRLSNTNQYFQVSFDIMMNGKSNLEFIGQVARGTQDARGMRLLSLSNGITKTGKVDLAKDPTAITFPENKWNHFQFVFQSSDVTNANGATDDKHKYWVYVNGALVTSGENIFVTDRAGYVDHFFGFDSLDIRMLTDYVWESKETTSNAELYLDNISLGVCEAFPETAYTKTVNFDSIGAVSDTTEAIDAFKANVPFFSETSDANCINKLEFVGGALGKDAKDMSAKLYQTENHVDVQRLIFKETGFEANKAPVINPGEWYMIEFEMAKLGTLTEGGIHAFYNHDRGNDGKGGPVLMKVTEGGSLYVNNTETGMYIDDDWHKYTLAIRAANPDGEGDETKDWVKLYVDDTQVLSEEFKTTTRVGGGEFEMLPEFKGIKQLWFQNFQKGAFDAEKAASSAVYFDNITVGNMGKTKKFDIDILDNDDPEIVISGANNGDEFDGDSIPTVTAVASDDYGIAKFEYYLDGELIETAPEGEDTIVASFENAIGGKHTLKFVAEDIYGIATEKTIEISFIVNKENTVYENDFEKYTGGLPSSFPQGSDNGGHGYLKDITVDEEHGVSMAIGIQPDVDESGEKDNWNSAGGNTAWAGIPVYNTSPTQTEFEFNISNRPAKYSEENGWQTTFDDFYRIYFRASGESRFLYIRPDYIELTGFTMEIGDAKVPYETNKWYKMNISVNPGSSTFGITITDGDTIIAKGTGNSYNGDIQALRVAGPYHGLSDGYLAIDNLTIMSRFGMPEFAAPEEGVVGGSNEFTVTLTESLMPSDVTEDTLVLENEFGRVAVKKAVLTGNDLVITTVSPIFGNMDYTLTLPNTTRFITGDEVGFVIRSTITTLPSNLQISDADLGSYAFSFNVLNTTGSAKNITLIFQTWNDNGQVTAVKAVTKEIAKNNAPQNYVIVHGLDVANDETITAFVWDGFNKPQAVSPVVYED